MATQNRTPRDNSSSDNDDAAREQRTDVEQAGQQAGDNAEAKRPAGYDGKQGTSQQ